MHDFFLLNKNIFCALIIFQEKKRDTFCNKILYDNFCDVTSVQLFESFFKILNF